MSEDTYVKCLERVAKATRIIFDVASKSGSHKDMIECPHGNIPCYPAHGWWCDGCFLELEDALSELSSCCLTTPAPADEATAAPIVKVEPEEVIAKRVALKGLRR